jgi:hypothetical protein
VKRLLLNQGLSRYFAAAGRMGRGPRVRHQHELWQRRRHSPPGTRRITRVRHADADFHSLRATTGERGPSVIRIREEGQDAGALAALLQDIWSRIADALRSSAGFRGGGLRGVTPFVPTPFVLKLLWRILRCSRPSIDLPPDRYGSARREGSPRPRQQEPPYRPVSSMSTVRSLSGDVTALLHAPPARRCSVQLGERFPASVNLL